MYPKKLKLDMEAVSPKHSPAKQIMDSALVKDSSPKEKVRPKKIVSTKQEVKEEEILIINDENELLPEALNELDENLEKELEMKAEKNNLTARNVKNMIKAVITDTEFLKMVDYSLQKSEEKPVYELKLTRAKTKELVGLDQNAIFNPPPPPKKSDIEALILTQELPEDSSDEEYEPHYELSEDEESKASEAGFLEEDGEMDTSIRTISSQDGCFTDENIGQRTRSKLCLSETPLETIEQAFVPPDITTDMYNTDCDNEDWLNFLKEFMQPLDPSHQETNDDDNDPEYNVMIDEEREASDKEELRADRAVKITKKELNELISEICEYTEMLPSSDEEEVRPRVKDADIMQESNELKQTKDDIVEEFLPEGLFSEAQYCLLKQQLQQHVQLLTQSFLMLCGLPEEFTDYLTKCSTFLTELEAFKNMNEKSFFNILNFDSSMKLIKEWGDIALRSPESTRIKKFIEDEHNKFIKSKKNKIRYHPALPPEQMKLCVKSDAFLYPLMLHDAGFSEASSKRTQFSEFEDTLFAMGLEEFSAFLDVDITNSVNLNLVLSYISEYLLIPRNENQLLDRFKYLLKSKTPNPVKEFYYYNKGPVVPHYVINHFSLKLLSSYPKEYFHENWHKYF